ncbi:MAG TPA: AMP-binding protein [Xanthobacteraceae bacterium]|nr:AMP-binding protein [Xanthobacteraceae bacterium]
MRQTYGPDYPRTLGALLTRSTVDPAAPAVTDAAGTLDRRAFQEYVLRVTAGLRTAGVGAGARVALWLPNGTGYLAAIFACARLGALAIHINTRFRLAEVGSLLSRSRAVALVTEWGFPSVDFPVIFAALPAEDRAALRCVLGLRLPAGVTQLARLPVLPLDGAAADAGPNEAAGETPCLTFTTSGTTSGPKLVLHDQQTIAGHAVDIARHIGLDTADAALLGAVPFCGTFGNAAAMAAIAGGAHVVCLAQFDGEAAAGLIRRHRVTHVIGGDDMFGRIAAAAGGRRFESVHFSGFAAFHSTAAASIAAAEAAGMHPHGLYGSSEVQALFSVSEGENRLLGGGVPVNRQARLVVRDPGTGKALASGASGELCIDAPSRFIAYLENPAATERAIGADGMFRSGDLARLTGTSFIFEARIGDAMRLGGFLVSPEEIEAVIQAQPGVAGVQVVAASRTDADPVPVAFVRPADGTVLDETALRARCREQLARFKVPERFVAVDAFPIVDGPNGPKVQRVRLREMAEALLREERHDRPRDVSAAS